MFREVDIFYPRSPQFFTKNGFNCVLLLVDCFSRNLYGIPMKSKVKAEVQKSLAILLKGNKLLSTCLDIMLKSKLSSESGWFEKIQVRDDPYGFTKRRKNCTTNQFRKIKSCPEI